MRTTIEIRPEHRAKLLEIAARRGEKGFSSVVTEAIESYLKQGPALEQRRKTALALRASFTEQEADELRQATARVRGFWR